MNDKTYLELERKIDKLFKKRNKISFLHERCTPAMYDAHGTSECERMEMRARRHNQRAYAKTEKYNNIISDILLLMVKSGYSIDNISSKYNITDILRDNPELSSALDNQSKKMN